MEAYRKPERWADPASRLFPHQVGFLEQRRLFDRLAERAGEAPPVIDSDDLLEDPTGIFEAYCNAVGIAYMPESLSWAPGARDEVSWWDGGSFHENLRNSDGLKPQKRGHIDISEGPDRVKGIYRIALAHYEHMHAHRLTAAAAE